MPITRDSLILRITQVGDTVSWREFHAIYGPYLHNLVRHWGLKEHDACDVVQDVFITLLRSLPGFRYRSQKGRFRGWLKTIAHRVVIDRLRRRGRMREVAIGREVIAKKLRPADEQVDHAYHSQVLQHAIRQVKSRSQPATWLCFEEHYLKARPAAEVGEELGLSSGAVYVNTSRTFERIRAICADFDCSLTSPRMQRASEHGCRPGTPESPT